MESMSGGVALFDFDNDGLVDIYLVDSLTVDTAKDPKSARSALYRNLGNGKFEDVTDKAGVGHPGWAMGVCTADVDGDGWEDVYVTGLGRNALYRNNHDGTFTDIAETAGLTAGGWSAGCGFADYDRDGDLDLFVSRYVKMDLENLPEFGKGKTCEYRGVAVQCGPRGLPGESDFLFRNDGDGRFTDVSEKAGVPIPTSYFGLGVAWFDYNADGWPDLYVANDSHPNYLYMNQKDGTFKESAFPMGVAVSEDGAEQGSMGVAVGDYDNVGRLSIYVTNFSEEYNALYHNDGDHFTDVSFRSKTAPISLPFVKLGHVLLRLRQRRLLGRHRRQRPRLPAARQAPARRVGRLPAAEAALPQPRRRDVRRGGGPVRRGHDRGARRPRSGRRRSRQRRAAGRGDQRPRRRPPAPAQRAGRRRQLAAREAQGQGREHRRHGRGRHAEGGQAQPDAAASGAGAATSPRTTCASTSASARRPGGLRRGALARRDHDQASRTSRPTRSWRSSSPR